MEALPSPSITKGSLLISTPVIDSGLYQQSVVLLCEHNENGSFGLLLNKPLQIDIPLELVDIDDSPNQRLSTWAGGPIQVGQMMLLHSSDAIPDQVLEITPQTFLGGDLDFLQKVASDPEGPFVRLCFGYSGWEPGQLEKECSAGYWLVQPSSNKEIFEVDPDELWQSLLIQYGDSLQENPKLPDDLSLN